MFSDILGTMKNVEIPATDEQLDKVLSVNKAMFDALFIEAICPYQRVRYVSFTQMIHGQSSFGEMKMVA